MNGNISGSKFAMFLLGATLALGFAVSASMISKAMVKMRESNVIEVKGYAEKAIRANSGEWRGESCVRAPELKAAYGLLEEQRKLVSDFIAEFKLKDGDWSFGPVSIVIEKKRNEKGEETSETARYVLGQDVEVRSAEVDRIQAVSRKASDLTKAGVEFRSMEPAYVCTGIEKLKLELLEKATGDGFERARTMAKHSGGNVGKLKSASQGVFQITAPNSTEQSSGGVHETTTIDKTIKAVVTLEFHVEK